MQATPARSPRPLTSSLCTDGRPFKTAAHTRSHCTPPHTDTHTTHCLTRARTIIFALCYFHAALLERKKFGVGNLPGATSGIGWNMNYPFNTGDLLCCGQTAVNYLDNNVKVGGGMRASVYILQQRAAVHSEQCPACL